MKQGDQVKVFRAGTPQVKVSARVLVSGANSLMIAMGEGGAALMGRAVAAHPVDGRVVTLLTDRNTEPFWRDMVTEALFGVVEDAE